MNTTRFFWSKRKWVLLIILLLSLVGFVTFSFARTPASHRVPVQGEAIPQTGTSRTSCTLLPNESPPEGASFEFKTDFSKHCVHYSEILSGGPSKDGIPALNTPQFVSVSEADTWLKPVEPVIFFQVGDLAGVHLRRPGRAGVGTGGMLTKVEAARIATNSGIPVVLTSAALAAPALSGDEVGTLFHRVRERPAARLFWLAHATSPRGRLHLDPGAVRAVVDRRASLLPAGITAVDGRFTAGDPVDLVDVAGRAVARGLVNYDAAELPGLLGRSTPELAAELGPGYEREVVHRDDLVLL